MKEAERIRVSTSLTDYRVNLSWSHSNSLRNVKSFFRSLNPSELIHNYLNHSKCLPELMDEYCSPKSVIQRESTIREARQTFISKKTASIDSFQPFPPSFHLLNFIKTHRAIIQSSPHKQDSLYSLILH